MCRPPSLPSLLTAAAAAAAAFSARAAAEEAGWCAEGLSSPSGGGLSLLQRAAAPRPREEASPAVGSAVASTDTGRNKEARGAYSLAVLNVLQETERLQQEVARARGEDAQIRKEHALALASDALARAEDARLREESGRLRAEDDELRRQNDHLVEQLQTAMLSGSGEDRTESVDFTPKTWTSLIIGACLLSWCCTYSGFRVYKFLHEEEHDLDGDGDFDAADLREKICCGLSTKGVKGLAFVSLFAGLGFGMLYWLHIIQDFLAPIVMILYLMITLGWLLYIIVTDHWNQLMKVLNQFLQIVRAVQSWAEKIQHPSTPMSSTKSPRPK